MKLLHIDSSILGENSVSRELSAHVVSTLVAENSAITVTYVDLAASPLEHLSSAHLAAAHGAPVAEELKADLVAGQKALGDFLVADVVVLGAPMYNFSVPSQLKAWIDRLAVAGKTFSYSEGKGPEGLCGGKKLIVASSRGGLFSEGTPAAVLDHQEAYLKTLFGFLGVTDVSFIRAEGLAMGEEMRNRAVATAKHSASTLLG
ncbi:FMN-dependent NADH-azoreductase [Pectobacterium brasiliense]|uniref:FMN-dependent NADH-azoreductase n=1 Tax=Pectobacterium brasiliense TaxID=180957 RepID=UPI001968F198|nr:FMN-dependent NADH-azoreductase [Pectobacterium brasiliense]MBN3229321.1 FMN-dependent NADH-azoreductase [Pectobacterium brasiliense]